MSDNQIIGASLQVDTGSSNANIQSVNKNLKDVKTSLLDTGSAAAAAGKDIEGAGTHFKNIKEQMAALPGPLGEAGEGVGKLNTAFKALLANPVVLILAAIVAVLATLYKSFTNTFEGGEKVEQIFAGIKAIGQSLIDNLDKIGSSIVKLFHFDFSGALQDMKDVGNAAADAYNRMASLTKQAQELHREQLANDLEQAQRAKQLAELREQATDESIPIAKRKAALQELHDAAVKNAAEDIDLAKRTAENFIAQKTIEKDGAKKNIEEITAARIKQVNVETDNANELRRINKQIIAADKQDQADRVAAEKEASEKIKAEREKLAAYNTQLLKLQQDNNLLTITDGYQKELQQLADKIANEKAVNEKAFQDHKLTKVQYQTIDEAITLQGNLQAAAITDKHNAEVQTKEVAFQKELTAITTKTRLDGITNSRELERVQLQIGYEEKLQDAITRYKNDGVKFQAIKNALDAQLKASQEKLEAKNKKEDDTKAFKISEEKQKAIIAAKNSDFEGKLEAVKTEQDLVQKAFDDKVITELDYNTKIAALADARRAIREQEHQEMSQAAGNIAGLLDEVSEAVGSSTAAGKTFAIAAATIKALQTEISIIANLSEVGPFGFVAGIAAAAATAIGLFATIKKIASVPVPGHGGSGGVSLPSPMSATAAPLAPTHATTQLDAKSLNAVGNAASRVYVLDSDVTSNRERDIRLNRAARLGG